MSAIENALMSRISNGGEDGVPATITLEIAKDNNYPIYEVQSKLRALMQSGVIEITDRLRLK